MGKRGLTAKEVANKKKPGRHRDGGDHPNLYLQITKPGVKSWLFRYQIGPRERWASLGPLHTVSLAEARVKARKYRQQLLDGIDPLDAKRKAAEAAAVEAAKDKTFAEVAQAYLKAHEHDWTNAKHAAQWEASLVKDCKAIAHLPIAAIDTAHVLQVLEPIWIKKPTTANRTRTRIELVLAAAIASGYRPLADGNPARWKGHLEALLAKKSRVVQAKRDRDGKNHHHAALDYKELPAFMAELRARTSIVARALEFLILTAARSSEVLGARWTELDKEPNTWVIPASRMKANKEKGEDHHVPLAPGVLALLQALGREQDNPYVFIGTVARAPLGRTALFDLLKEMRPDVTVHGFRSSFRTWASERTNYPREVCEKALAHAVGSAVERAYERTTLFDKRRKLMEAWSRYCAIKPAATGATVVALRKAR
jgi:integrase